MSLHYKYLETNRIAKKRWKENNRDYYNAWRRKHRAKKKAQMMEGKKCLNCEILMSERAKGVRIYCRGCVDNYPLEVRRHKWRRYYYKKMGRMPKAKKVEKLKPSIRSTMPMHRSYSSKYIVSWRSLKSHG